MEFIGKTFRFVVFGCFIYAIWWFVTFNLDPQSLCKPHPDKSKRKDYYMCRPFNIEVSKETTNDSNLWKDKYGKNSVEGTKKELK